MYPVKSVLKLKMAVTHYLEDGQ